MIRFTNVKIPKENLLWEEGRGLAMALGTINVGRLTLPAASAGGAKQLLSIARRWGKKRQQWGLPIGQHEAGREKIAYIAAVTFAMEAVTWLTSSMADEKKVDIRIEAAMAKLFCTEELWKIADLTLQLRGGRGFEKARSLESRGEEPFGVERALRDCRVNMILEGSSEIMKLFLAREAIDPHLKKAKKFLNPKSTISEKVKTFFSLFGHYIRWYPKQLLGAFFSKNYNELELLAKHYRFIDKTAHRLSRSLFEAMVAHQQKLEKRQLILGRLMEIGTYLFVIAATCSYAKTFYKTKNEKQAIQLANYFCLIARRRIHTRFKKLEDNDDRELNQLAKSVLNDEARFLEEGIIWVGADE
jgi:hypothetical protein